MSNGRILIVDDDEDISRTLKDRLRSAGYEVGVAADGREGLRKLGEDEHEVVLLDLQMPKMDGMEVLSSLLSDGGPPPATIVVMTAYGNIERAVEAMKAGAFDFIPKPFEMEQILISIEKALAHERLRRDMDHLREVHEQDQPDLVSASSQMEETLALARRAAESNATVLIQGESGTGKGMLAAVIHRWSARRDRPFVAVNCVGLPENLLETELFGHEKGAFTGADRRRRGRFELAQGGTIFLDEIGATEASLQVKLLQVLQEKRFERVGGEKPVTADVRVLAASNRNLHRMMEQGEFLADLYYRLNVITVSLPPLRERPGDIRALAESFLGKYVRETKRPVDGISEEAMTLMQQYGWPGNVRELENAIERAVVLGQESEIGVEDLPEHVVAGGERGAEGVRNGYQQSIECHKRELIRNALVETGGNQTRAAELLGLHRTHLSRLIRSLKVEGV